MNYERIRRRGVDKVACEIMLMCLGRLLNSFDENKFKSTCWGKAKNLKKRDFSNCKAKKEPLRN